jgi:hypothetical protein
MCEIIFVGEMYLYNVSFSTCIQSNLKRPNSSKVDLLTKELREKMNGWKEQVEGSQNCKLLIFFFDVCHIKD